MRKRRFGGIGARSSRSTQQSTAETIRSLERDGRVAYAEPNFVLRADVPNDPFMTRLWGLDNLGQTVNWSAGAPDADIDAREAWSVSTGSPDVVVAVIDTGVELAHPDLAANIWVNQGEDCPGCRTNGSDDDGNGYVDDWRGWDFVNGDNNPTDDMGHGTHVSGTIAAVGNNGLGVAGVTWSTKVMPLKFLSAAGTGTVADAISAILYANANGAAILNSSWGGDEFSQALLDAIEQTRRERSALRRRGREQLRQQRSRAQLSVRLRGGERRLGRGDRPVRPSGVVLELRNENGRPRRAGHEHLLGLARRLVSLPGRHVDGHAARVRAPPRSQRPSSRARAGSASRRCFCARSTRSLRCPERAGPAGG